MPALLQHAPNKQTAMTVRGIFLTAEERNAEPLHALLKPDDRRSKCGIFAKQAVDHSPSGIVVGSIRRPPAQLRPEKKIADAGRFKRFLHRLSIKLRDKLGIRRAPRVDDNFDAMLAHKRKPNLDAVVGMTDGQKIAHALVLLKGGYHRRAT